MLIKACYVMLFYDKGTMKCNESFQTKNKKETKALCLAYMLLIRGKHCKVDHLLNHLFTY